MSPEIGVFAQDQWAIDRLTVNFGLRYDYANFRVDEENLPAGPFAPARHSEGLNHIPQWSDWNPRVGASLEVGRRVDDKCLVIDSPQELLYCRVVTPPRGLADLRLHANYELPAGFLAGASERM